MVKIPKISDVEPALGFTEFDILEKYHYSLVYSELSRLFALFHFSELARTTGLKESL